jgi:hypothetical protein
MQHTKPDKLITRLVRSACIIAILESLLQLQVPRQHRWFIIYCALDEYGYVSTQQVGV